MPRTLAGFVAALACAAVLIPGAAEAYIGPGVGAGAFAAVVGVIGSIFLAIVGVIYYPIKRMLKRKKSPAAGKPAE
jgi:TM2 domain-containing membrane protein YozV